MRNALRIGNRSISYEQAKEMLFPELIVEMAEYFHVSLDYLLLGETESNSKAKRDILAVIESLTRIAREL